VEDLRSVGCRGEAIVGVKAHNMRPLLGDAIYPGDRQGAVGPDPADLPAAELAQACVHQRLSRCLAVAPIGVAGGRHRPEQQPSDVACVSKGLPDIRVGPVLGEQGSGHDAATLFGDQGAAFTDPGADDELLRLTFELAQHHVHRSRHPGITAAACALTSLVTCSRSAR
jgi:hypothetical protein